MMQQTQKDGVRRRRIGYRGEELAAAYLEERGWTIVERNWTTKGGEVDIIASRRTPWGDEWVEQFIFVEVKARRSTRVAPPEASVTREKRKRIAQLAKVYMKAKGLTRVRVRLDVIAVELGESPARVKHIPAAFDARGRL